MPIRKRSDGIQFERSRRVTFGESSMTPLIDIVFQLLLFFALTLSVQNMTSMKVTLPTATSAEIEDPEIVLVTIDSQGAVFLGEKEITLNLITSLQDEVDASPSKIVRIEADEGANVGRAVEVLDAARIAGARVATIGTARPRGGSEEAL